MQGDRGEDLEMHGDRGEELEAHADRDEEDVGLVSGAAAAAKQPRVRGHGGKPFTAAEEDELRRGVGLHGNGAWAAILRTGGFAAQRTNVDLKDKWRNMARAGEPTPADTPLPPGGGGGESRQRAKRPLSPYSPTTGPEVGGAPRQRAATPATPATPATAAAASAAAAAAAAPCLESAEVAPDTAGPASDSAAPAAAAAAATGWRRKGPERGAREPTEADLLGLALEQKEVVHLALQGKSFLITGPGGCGEPG